LGSRALGLANLIFVLGPKDGKCHFKRNGPHQRIISCAEKTPKTLYDYGEKRAWLVFASEVMLHMAHHRHYLESFESGGKRIQLVVSSPEVGCEQPVRQTLINNASMSLSDCEQYTIKDLILNIWSLLEFLIDQNVQSDCTEGVTLLGAVRDILRGYEYKAVTEERSPF
jgi:hypothetical protein